MFLEKLEIQGFKSFAQKNLLVFPGMLNGGRRGLTAIVGPNGSGKSNIADAVRWVLGEQSMKALRGKKSEDVIFSGSARLGRLGMAEVSLFLNNEDRKAPIDYSEVVLTRRLYRDGASEYLINNSRVRLSDVQIMLAKASFGQKTYSVIGQGMVEGFLNTSLAERKEFFDEATGIKQFQIKRDDALNKLRSSVENLNQAQMILLEIEPRLRSLTKQVNKLQKRGELETDLKNLQLIYYRKLWHDINDKFNAFNKQFLELEKIKIEKEKKLTSLNQRLEQLEKQKGVGENFHELQAELAKLQNQRDAAAKLLAKVEAKLEMKLESSGQFDLSWLKNKARELATEIKTTEEEIRLSETESNAAEIEMARAKTDRDAISDKIRKLNQSLLAAGSALSGDELKGINRDLKNLFDKLELAEAQADLESIKIILTEIKKDLSKILELAGKSTETNQLEAVQTELIGCSAEQEKLILKLDEAGARLAGATAKLKILKEKRGRLETELENAERQIKTSGGQIDPGEFGDEKERLSEELKDAEEKAGLIRAQIATLTKREGEERSQLFELQKNLQKLQNELNDLNRELGDIKINSTRFETRLEDLENEIRKELGGLKEVRAEKTEGQLEIEPLAEKIGSLKRQLDLIGGIDPEIEKEYIETKERHDFLAGQTKDLENTIGSLEQVITELDLMIKERFDKEFKIIAGKFEEYFKILFNGGRAEIIKVMEGDDEEEEEGAVEGAADGEGGIKPKKQEVEKNSFDLNKIKYLQKHNATGLAGIEIQATPPGKKIKSISMLSGGERALTAIALICAIINVNPSPFVVLDEVDAALDEANSERLAKILDDLSHKSQFIVITHNRASMRRANVLYGVTMGDDGVSKLLSIKLEEGEAKSAK